MAEKLNQRETVPLEEVVMNHGGHHGGSNLYS